jgi:hypothetical protein
MTNTRTFTFVVKITVPVDTGAAADALIREATSTEARAHVREAVECWGGQYHPDDPFFSGNVQKVTVVSAPVRVSP